MYAFLLIQPGCNAHSMQTTFANIHGTVPKSRIKIKFNLKLTIKCEKKTLFNALNYQINCVLDTVHSDTQTCCESSRADNVDIAALVQQNHIIEINRTRVALFVGKSTKN